MRHVLNISTKEITPKKDKNNKFDEYLTTSKPREYSSAGLIDIYCISEGLIHKIFYSYSAQIAHIKNSKLENAIKTLGMAIC